MEWAFIWLMVALKVPLIAAIWIIWWSIRAEPAGFAEDRVDGDEGGGGGHHPRLPRPRRPRRGPHADRAPGSPRRVRARGRRHEPARR